MYPMSMSVHQQRYSEPQQPETIVFGPKLIPKTPLESNEQQFSYENGSHSSNSNTDTSLKQMLPVRCLFFSQGCVSLFEINNAENVVTTVLRQVFILIVVVLMKPMLITSTKLPNKYSRSYNYQL